MAAGRKTGGRAKGVPNKTTANVKALAQKHGPEAIDTLVKIMKSVASGEAARVSAANSILDRAYGKPKQAIIGGDEDDPAISTRVRVEVVWPT